MKIDTKKIRTGSQALIKMLWIRYGGPAQIHQKFFPEIPRQDFVNWRERGRVPLKLVHKVADKLGISIWGLNYEDLAVMYPTKIPSWRQVVFSYNFKAAITGQILYLKPPKIKGKK